MLYEKNEKVIFVGNAVDMHKEYIKNEIGDLCHFPNESDNVCKASSVGMIAYRMWQEGKVIDSFKLMPFYLRKSSAEQEYEKRMASDGNSNCSSIIKSFIRNNGY